MNAAEQAREQLCKMERDIIRMMAAFRESTGLRVARFEIHEVLDGSGRVMDQAVTIEARL